MEAWHSARHPSRRRDARSHAARARRSARGVRRNERGDKRNDE